MVLTGEGSDETLAGYTRYAFTLKNMAFDRVYRGVVPAPCDAIIRDSIATSSWINATARRKLSHTFLGLDGELLDLLLLRQFLSPPSTRTISANSSPANSANEVNAGAAYRNVLGYWEKSSG